MISSFSLSQDNCHHGSDEQMFVREQQVPKRPRSGEVSRSQSGTSAPRGSRNRTLWNIRGAALVRLDTGKLDHLGPLLGFFGDQLAELDRRSRQRRAAEISETGLHLGVVESRVDLLIEPVDDLGRR